VKTAFHIDEVYRRHRNPDGHPERVARIEVLLELAKRASELGVAVLPARRRATSAELALVHRPEYVEAIASTAGRSLMLDPDTFTGSESYDVACHAAGAVLDLVDRVVAREFDHAFAAVRPPGHHAESERAMGFCLFNNVAVAGAYALERHRMERVLVVDWDVHHGNGTQDIFWSDPRVLYMSLHQSPFYPGTGRFEEVGEGDGRGFTVNIPLPGGFGDDEWTDAFRRVVVPVARAFDPQLVLVSAGFDAHANDPLGGMRVSENGFAAMADSLLEVAREHAEGRLIAVLEGGYDVDALSKSVEAVLGRMSGGGDVARAQKTDGAGRFGEVFARIKAAQSPYWKL
jgi:acetoin utilization deacetylase AcuC-like enzyme